MRQACVTCGRPLEQAFQPFCECGGIAEVVYDLAHVTLQDSPNPYIRFADLIPVSAALRDRLPQGARYTPTIHATRLGEQLGMAHLYLKDETVLPTCSTKDRMAAVSLAYLWERGVRGFCTSSTGNSSTAYAHAVRQHPDMRLVLFTAESFRDRVQHADHEQVTHFCLRGATFVDAFEHAGVYARQNELVSERGFFNPGRREGLKLAFFEASEQVERPIDWYVQAVSSAMGVYGTYKGAKELLGLGTISQLPRLLCVQQESCAPMVHAFNEGCPSLLPRHIVKNPTGIAEAILRGDSSRAYPWVRGIVRESNGAFLAVTETEIREAQRMAEDLEGVAPCFSASTALAGVIQRARAGGFTKDSTVLVNLTGGDRPRGQSPSEPIWLARTDAGWA